MSQTSKLVKIYLPSKVLNRNKSGDGFYLSGLIKITKASIHSLNSIYEIFINKFSSESNKLPNNIGKISFSAEQKDDKKDIKQEVFLCIMVKDENLECKLFYENKELTSNVKFMIFIYNENQNIKVNLLKKIESNSSATKPKNINENKFSGQESLKGAIEERINNLNSKPWAVMSSDVSEFLKNLIHYYFLFSLCFRHHDTNQIRKRAKITSFMINLLFGVFFSSILLFNPFFDTFEFLNFQVSTHTENMLINLTSIIKWLMGIPAGLKLNKPLNEFLGRFFLYHIYLWNSSLELFNIILPFLLKSVIYSGFLGLSFLVAMLVDVFRILTIHNYCFYIYALRIYKIELDSLKSLFRLFRGKKLNPLRSRIDSYSYNVDQLFIGTLGFCIVFFLLPTILMFYVVFLAIRLLIGMITTILKLLIGIINNIPLYEFTLFYVRNSSISPDQLEYSISNKYLQSTKVGVIELKVVKKSLNEILQITECNALNIDLDDMKKLLPNIFNGEKI